jgi:hypothetical protein
MLERACVALSGESVEEGGGVMSKSVRHFLDISELPPKELRNMLAASVAMKAKLKAHEEPEAARRQDAGDDLRTALDPHRVSFDVGMRQLGGESIMLTGPRCSSAAARPSPIPRACCRAMSMRS